MSGERKVLVALCKCGGWVMVAALGVNPSCDRDSFRDAGDMAAEGYEIRTVPKSEYMAIPACKHRGACTTNPASIPDPAQTEMEMA